MVIGNSLPGTADVESPQLISVKGDQISHRSPLLPRIRRGLTVFEASSKLLQQVGQ